MKTAILILTLASSLFGQFTSTNAKRIQGKNVGSLSLCADGDALTWVAANSRFECVAGGGGGGAPTNAQYLTLATNASLSVERVLTMDSNMTATDGGAGGAYTIGPDTAKMESRATQQAGTSRRCADSGGDDTYTCTMTPTLTEYTDGMVVEFEATVTANTGAATLEIDTLGSGTGKAIKLCDGTTDPATGDIAVGKQVALRYDGTVFRLPCNPTTVTSSSDMVTAAGTLTSNAPMIGAGSKAASVGSRSGNTTEFATVNGTKTTGKQLRFDASGNIEASASDIGGGGSTPFSQAVLDNNGVSMTGSDVTMATISNVPALAAGSCYIITGISVGSATWTGKIFVDATQIATPITASAAGYYQNWSFRYCNTTAQSAQKKFYTFSCYATNIGLGWYCTSYFGENALSTPTAVDWSTSHTITFKMNAASGTADMPFFEVRQ